ncbi:MAG: tRNA (guanosine(46)-N7)-methyltransferase TrmB [Betaproteobacteria bacterium]|jgi:tRNA (guanine-N7-)-methyltransferase
MTQGSDAPHRAAAPAQAIGDAPQGEPTRSATHIRSFVTRRGHISAAQERALREVLPRVRLAYAAHPLDLVAAFGRSAPTVLEIGFGMGETTAAIAHRRPDVNFLAIDVFAAGCGALAKRIDEMALSNLRVMQHDAVEIVRDMLMPDLLAGVHIYFPDPWPKARHHKRRLVAPPFVALLASRIAPGGYLHCATDWQHYAEQMLAVLSAEALLENLHESYAPAPRNPLAERPTTKFHARGTRLGHGVWDLVFKRKG